MVVAVRLVDRVGIVGVVGAGSAGSAGSAECVDLVWFDLRCGAMVRY